MTTVNQSIIRAESLSKRFRIGKQDRYLRFSEALTDLGRSMVSGIRRAAVARRAGNVTGSESELWALRDISFEISQGEVVGLIGRNGSGKSTLLKILSRITEPTSGRVGLRGRVGSLLEVSTGFHPELTGRENIYLNGAILGMSHREISRRFDEIVAFSELERFLDTPVKHYSSGMYVRLGFSIAAHLEPEILILDEVLAVGDARFQAKCIRRLQELRSSIQCIILVTHNMIPVRAICTRAMLLSQGRLHGCGPPETVISDYERLLIENDQENIETMGGISSTVTIDRVELHSDSNDRYARIETGKPLRIAFRYQTREVVQTPIIYVAFRQFDGFVCAGSSTKLEGYPLDSLTGAGQIEINIDRIHLAAGHYNLDITIYDQNFEFRQYFLGRRQTTIEVVSEAAPSDDKYGVCRQAYEWRVSQSAHAD